MLKNENLIKQLEQMQKILMETVKIKTNEIEILKQKNEALNDQVAAPQSIDLSQKSEEFKNLKLNLKEIKLLVNNLINFELNKS